MSTIFTFFARLAQNSGYLATVDKLELADLPDELIAATSSRDFPDLVLKTVEREGETTGGEFVELKDARSMSITSFNSSIPTGTKSLDSLSAKMRREIEESDSLSPAHDVRDVCYLIRGRNLKATPSPITKAAW